MRLSISGWELLNWQSKEQTCVLVSIVEAEYNIVSDACISQVIWIQIQLRDYTINMKKNSCIF